MNTFVDMLDIIYDDWNSKRPEGFPEGIPFTGIVDVILNMRGSNTATVRDCKEQIKVLKAAIDAACLRINNKIHAEIQEVKLGMMELQDDVASQAATRNGQAPYSGYEDVTGLYSQDDEVMMGHYEDELDEPDSPSTPFGASFSKSPSDSN
eukprot:TRINITY_DN39514_c0_g1_i1.p1 TRINITY_DN39514_c0_g1~~TRINITY_DN39514_c0_g1_i1.p1  ORF type:complete len:151 (+),score=34.33 TRINITY_DN39514_c0_g1_i1:2-454(+)